MGKSAMLLSRHSNDITIFSNRNLPVFDLFHVGMNDTPLTDALKNNEQLQNAIMQRYCTIFDRFKSVD